jgi:plastocyanin
MFAKSLIVAAASLMMVNAANIPVDVGKGGITFTPNTVTAAKGDVLVFTFDSGPHSVTQGTFATPCQPSSGGFNSGLYVILVAHSLRSRALMTPGIF